MKSVKGFRIEQSVKLLPSQDGTLININALFLHGFGGDINQLQPIGDYLSVKGLNANYISMRGHGDSISPTFGYSCIDMAADIHRLIHGYRLPIHIIGYSHGGLVGAVTTILLSKSKVSSLVIIDESFTEHPERMIEDAHYEARYLRWMFDWKHLLDIINVPTLFLVAEESHMIDNDELGFLMNCDNQFIRFKKIHGDHHTCIKYVENLSALIEDFYINI